MTTKAEKPNPAFTATTKPAGPVCGVAPKPRSRAPLDGVGHLVLAVLGLLLAHGPLSAASVRAYRGQIDLPTYPWAPVGRILIFAGRTRSIFIRIPCWTT